MLLPVNTAQNSRRCGGYAHRYVGNYYQSTRQNISEETEPTLLRNVGTGNNLPVYKAYPPRITQSSATLLQELGITFRTMALYNTGTYLTFMQPG